MIKKQYEVDRSSNTGENLDNFEDTSTPLKWGRFGHAAYEYYVEYEGAFDDVTSEESVIITKPDGVEAEGRIDTLINEKVIIDYKTDDMTDWDAAKATAIARSWSHGPKVKAYVDSPETPQDAKGWIVATQPPKAEEVRQAYADGLAEFGVGVKWAESQHPDQVIDAIRDAVKDSQADTTGT